MKTAAMVLIYVLILGLIVSWQVSVWNECRQTNSFWYCVRVLSK